MHEDNFWFKYKTTSRKNKSLKLALFLNIASFYYLSHFYCKLSQNLALVLLMLTVLVKILNLPYRYHILKINF